MKLVVTRRWENEVCVTGTMDVNGIAECFTIERPRTGDHPCIPEGTYEVTIRESDHFNKPMPHIENVPGRSGILIHAANWASQLLGCVAVGQTRGQNAIFQSVAAFNQLYGKIQAALASGDTVSIEIKKNTP